MFGKKKTPDQELADNLRAAVAAFNKARRDCKDAKLSIGIRDKGSSSYSSVYGDIEVEWVGRNNFERF